MCFGICGLEDRQTGMCSRPDLCSNSERGQAAAELMKSEFYCPDCEAGGKRHWLNDNGDKFICPHCELEYTTEELRDAYQGEYDDLMSDAAWVMAKIKSLGVNQIPATANERREAACLV